MDTDAMPARERFNSGEWVAVQQEIAAAVSGAFQSQREGIRSDLREFRDELKADVGRVRQDVGKLEIAMAQGDGLFKLLDQRMTWIEKEHDRREQLDQDRLRLGHSTDTSRINKALADVTAREVAKHAKGDRDSDRSKLLINPKVINAAILAFATAGGASIWALIEHAFAPAAPPPSVSAPAVGPNHTTASGGSTGTPAP